MHIEHDSPAASDIGWRRIDAACLDGAAQMDMLHGAAPAT